MVIRALDRKLLRDLGRLRGQVITIALVVASGIAAWICLRSAYASLLSSRDAYYASERFGDVFAHARRVPGSVAARLDAIEGVAAAYPRLVETASLPVDFLPEPAVASVVSLPPAGEPPMNGLVLLRGRLPDPARDDEAVLLEAFAERHRVEPGTVLPAVMEGRRRAIRVVGIAMSPEFVFATTEGAIAAENRFAVLWMPRGAVAAAYRMEGAFDDVVLRLQPGASEPAVIAEVDRILAPYGGRGAVGRALQPSSYFLEGELVQLQAFAMVAPLIFLAVAAFLLHVVLSRLVLLQRAQIATLKAVGYRDREIGLHYLELVTVMVALGAAIGVGAGAWLGRGMVGLYAEYFRFPGSMYRLDAGVVATGLLTSFAAGVAGAAVAVRGVTRMPPAEAMRPPAPARYRAGWLSAGALARLFDTSGRMVLRELERRPLRVALSSAGIAMAIAILIVGRFSTDALEHLIETQFEVAMREDLSVSFDRALPERVVRELAHLPGVERAEGIRRIPAKIRLGPRARDAIVVGHRRDRMLGALVDGRGLPIAVPEEGLVITGALARILGARVGDAVTLDVLEDERPTRTVRVVALADEPFGLWGHMDDRALHRLLGQEPRVSGVALRVDASRLEEVRARLVELPRVVAVTRRRALIDHFREESGRSRTTMTAIMTAFAVIIAIGVVYNNARVALASRARDLASLRVLGFTRREISAVLLGELAAQIVLAVPIGIAAGTGLAHAVMSTTDPERYRLEVVISPATYAFAVAVTLGAGAISALLVRRRLDRLDLVSVLKTRE